jgi:hypothetical protein
VLSPDGAQSVVVSLIVVVDVAVIEVLIVGVVSVVL